LTGARRRRDSAHLSDWAFVDLQRWTSMTVPVSHSFAVTSEFRPLHKYLHDRYADSVVLTFAEIEDLLGFTLPDVARMERSWWADADPDNAPSPQSLSWTRANRTASPKLPARVVVFERTSA
jgi:hypothetical protein